MVMVAHCGKSVAGSHVHRMVLADIASAWTVAAAMVVREQTLVTVTVEDVRRQLPFPLLGLDVDNDGAFINETLVKAVTISGEVASNYLGGQRTGSCKSRPGGSPGQRQDVGGERESWSKAE
jgi:hypothetical protein